MKLSLQQYGYTLIELVVVIALLSIVTTGSIIGFVSYNNKQSLSVTTSDMQNMLQTARSYALSQVRPSTLSTCAAADQLLGYKVFVCATSTSCSANGNNYELHIVCGATHEYITGKKFPQDIAVDTVATSADTYFFKVLTGGVAMSKGNTAIGPLGEIHLVNTATTPNLKRKVSVDSAGNTTIADE
jgi:prepilin-type N-terminal cleavage/methylation domain-containing protein